MVAIVSGGTLGLGANPVNLDNTAFGGAVAGNDGAGVYVNASSGNLVVEQRDEFLAGLGVGGSLARTYNSQGELGADGDNGDGWRMGMVKTLSEPVGGVNQPGSTLTRTDGDGGVALYKYDAASGLYVTTDGTGAYDTIALKDAGGALWTDGTTGTTETYDGQNRLVAIADQDGNITSLTYDAHGMLSSVTQPGGSVTYLDYNGTQLTQVRTVSNGHSEIRDRYTYDDAGRLSQVSIDLSPEDNSIDDGNIYVTNYSYDGDSTRLANMTQSDGSSLSFTYAVTDGRYQVASVTNALGEVTRFSYDGAGTSNVTDPTGAVTSFTFDTAGQLLQTLRPVVDGVRIANSYSYDANGNLVGMVDGNGQTTTMAYDARGNLTSSTDPIGVTTTRTYDAHNRLLSEVTGNSGDTTSMRYAYDANGNLRFIVDGDGAVIERRYNSNGSMVEQLKYPARDSAAADLTSGAPLDQDSMVTWAAAQNAPTVERSTYTYDFRGQLSSTSTFTTDANGVVTESVARYVYDQHGRLISSVDAHAGDTTGASQTSYAYDGLNRVLGMTDALGNHTAYQYDDAQRTIKTTFANGLASTRVTDAAGRLISVTSSDTATNAVLATSQNRYDADGRLIKSVDANGLQTRYLYDDAGRQVATIDAAGQLTEFFYDANDNLVRTVQYGQAVDQMAMASTVVLDAVRPTPSASDRTTQQVFDADNRLIASVDALGFVTAHTYDSNGRLNATITYATALNADTLSKAISVADATPPASNLDRTVRYFYDNAGHVVGQLDAAGFLTVRRYDGAGNLTEQVAYAITSDPALSAAGRLDQLVPDSTGAMHQYWFYDGQGRQIGSIAGEGYLTEMRYDADGNLASVVQYATRTSVSGPTLDAVRPVVSLADERQVFEYDGLHRQSASIGIDGTRTINTYDAVGKVVASTVEADTPTARTTLRQYDVQGRVTADLSPRGAALLTGNSATDAAVWAQYGTSYSYDAGGRIISARAPGGDNTLYFYDALGRITQTVNALGEVHENTYDAFGQVVSTKTYASRVNITGLQGGDNGMLTAALAKIADPLADTVTKTAYDARGEVTSLTDGLGQNITRVYDAFGELVAQTAGANSVVSNPDTTEGDDGSADVITGPSITTFAYDNRGQLTTKVDASGVFNLTTSVAYDAFGREISRVDARGNTSFTEYDRDGRVVVLRDRLNSSTSTSYDAFGRVLTQTDGNGNASQYTYDDEHRSFIVKTADGVTTSVAKNAEGQVISVRDGAGAETHYAYDVDGNLLSTTDALGHTVTREYDAADHLVASVDADGMRTEYRYDAANRLLSQIVDTTGLSLTTTYQYDTRGETIAVRDASGILTTTSYDADGQILRTVQDVGGVEVLTQFSYDAQGHVLSVTRGGADDLQEITNYSYDAAGRLIQKVVDPDTLGLATKYTYDEDDNLVDVNDPAGFHTFYTYDADGRMLSRSNDNGDTTTYAYDANGNRTGVTNPNGNTAITIYDSQNRVVAQTDADGNTVHYGYDAAGRQTSSTNALGAVTTYSYDVAGRLTGKVDPLGNATTYGYDAAGNRTSVSDAFGVTSSTYDSANRLVAVTDALGNTTRYTLDALGRRIAVTDSLGGVITTVYDGAGRVAQLTDATGGTTSYKYDGNGNVVSITDANGNVSQLTYDGAGELTSQTDAAGNTTSYDYDPDGNRNRMVDANGNSTFYEHDANGRLVEQSNYVGEAYVTVAYSYDAAGQLSSKTDGNGAQTSYTYDAAGQVVAMTDGTGAVTTYAYDKAGNRVTSTDPEGNVTAYAYDAIHRLLSRTDALGRIAQFTYDARGRRISSTDENGNVTSSTYDADDRMLTQTDAAGNTEQYRYDAVGNRIATIDRLGNETQYHYDAAARLVGIDGELGASESYTYDAAGNMVSTTNMNGATVTRAYDVTNRLIGVTDALGNHTSYTYDAVGNRIGATDGNGNTSTWTYDALNRLTSLTVSNQDGQPVLMKSYGYDGAGNVVRTIDGYPEAMYDYVFDDDGNVVSETIVGYFNSKNSTFDAMGRVTATYMGGALTASFTYDGAGNLKQKTAYFLGSNDGVDSGTTTYNYDALNRLVSTVDSLGNEQLTSYDATGNVLAKTDGNGNITSYTYDALNRVVRTVDALGGVATNQYDDNGNVISSTDRSGRTTTKTYDAAGRLISNVDPLGLRTTYAYDAVGNIIAVTDGAGQTTLSTYDAANNLISTRDALGNLVTFAYDAAGNRIQRIGARGEISTFTYDAAGHLTSASTDVSSTSYFYDLTGYRNAIVQAGGQWQSSNQMFGFVTNETYVAGQPKYETFSYDVQGNRTTSGPRQELEGGNGTDPLTYYYYDTESRLIGVRDPNGGYTTIEYDGAGNRTSVIDGDGNRTTYVYDALNRLVSTIDPTGHADTVAYDNAGNQVAKTDRNGNTTTFEYDLDNRLTAIVAPDGQRTQYVLDNAGRHLVETLAAGTADARTQSYVYDAVGHVVTMTAPDGTVTSYQYDASGNAISRIVTDTKGMQNVTRYAYDNANRLVSTTTDADGLAITEQIVWDANGQIGQKIDGAGRVSVYEYDQSGNLQGITSGDGPMRLLSQFYDASGNLEYSGGPGDIHHISEYDAAGRVSSISTETGNYYDAETDQTSYDGATTYSYDGAGNMILSVDPQGRVTNNYYDSNNRLVAQLDGDDVLHEFDYDPVGNKIAERLYMDRQPNGHLGSVRPQGTGEVRVTTFAYDSRNRLVHTTYPTVSTTQLSIVDGVPHSSIVTVTPTAARHYDTFGNLVETVALDGKRSVSYYDIVNRVVAQVDPQGVLTQYSYDGAGHVTEKRVFATALNNTDVIPGNVPIAPPGLVTVTSSTFDGVGRQVGQHVASVTLSTSGVDTAAISAAAAVAPGAEVTVNLYDGSNNMIQQIRAPGLPEQQNSYFYYDANNHMIGSIDPQRGLTLYSYDFSSGELMGTITYANPVDASVNLATLDSTYAALSSVAGSSEGSKGVIYQRDYANQITRETRSPYGLRTFVDEDAGILFLDAGEATRDIFYGYDAAGRRTSIYEGRGQFTTTSYDAAGRVTAVHENGVVSRQVYDAAGNVVIAYSGELNTPAGEATNIQPTLDAGVKITYNLPGPGLSSYVVWDTVSHDISANNSLTAYANQTREASVGKELNGNATIAGATGVLFYRVVTVDAAGNKSYSGEQSVNAVSPLQDVQISRVDSITIEVRMKLADGLTAPVLVTGQYGWPYPHTMTLDSDGYYEVQLIDARDPSEFWYQFTWTNADGSQASSSRQQPDTAGGQFGDTVITTEVPSNGGVTAQMTLAMPSDAASAYTLVTARWRLAGSNSSFATEVAASGPSVNLAIGGSGGLQVGQSYEVLISGIDAEGNATVLNSFLYKPTGLANAQTTSTMLVLPSSSVGDNQLVIVDGQPVALTEVEGSTLASLRNASTASVAFYKTEKVTSEHTTTLTADPANASIAVKTVLSANEATQVADGLHFSWRSSGSATDDGTTFANDALMTQEESSYNFDAAGMPAPATGIDYKIWYTDADGRQVIVDWSATLAGANSSRTARSDIVLAAQLGGSIANGNVTAPDDRRGQVDVADFNSGASLHATYTGLGGGSIMTSALEQGYGRTSQYDALNHLIGTTGDDGVWTKYGVDLDGNVLTTTRQDVENGVTQTTYTKYDIEGRVTAQYGPAFTSADGSLQRTVTTTTYDVFGHATSMTDAFGAISTVMYDMQGRVLQQTDALGNSKRYAYDTLGNSLNVTDENGNVTEYQYDSAGNRISETDAGGMHRYWQYDAFGRVTAEIDGNGNRVEIAYDSLDRVVQRGSTTFHYDDFDHTIYQGDAGVDLGLSTTTSYDVEGRVTGVSAYNTSKHGNVSSSRSYDTYGNLISETDEEGRTTRSVYGPNSHLLSTIDPDGKIVSYTYDSLGRRSSETGSGRNIVYSYDEAGHLSQIADLATGTTTRYSYDAAGRQVHESVSGAVDQFGKGHGREIDTVYDALGRVAAWSDSVTGTQESYTYDGVGNRIRVQGSGPGTTDHGTDYDGAGRVIALRENGAVVSTYTYDAAGNRVTATSGGVTTTYTYDNAHRVLNATTPASLVEWQYDYSGNITLYRESTNGVVRKTTSNQYDSVGHNIGSTTETVGDDGKVTGQQTTNTFDDSGRLLSVKLHTYGKADKTYFYLYTYTGDGRELSVRAFGDAKGNATFTYDVDNNLVKVNQGQGDGQTRSEVSTFVYDNNGHILAKYHDDGTATIQDHLDYVYVQGNPAATTGTSIATGGVTTILDTENYALFQNIDSSFPTSSVVPYTVRAGETLQSIADLVYGDRSLWYLIADANGLTGNETLATGRVLTIPARSQTGAINGDTHTVYSQDDVVGSTLPNLKSPPPPGHGCSGLLQVLVVVIAVVVTVYTAGLLAAPADAVVAGVGTATAETAAAAGAWSTGVAVLGGTATGISTTGGLLAAGLGGAAGSIVSQGVAIATGLQDSFSWRGVAEGFVGAAVTAGVGAYAQTAVVVPGVQTNALPGASLLNKTGVYGRVALTNAATQGLSVATHLQDSFSWRSVGAAAIAAGVGNEVNNAIGAVKMPGLADALQGTVLTRPYAADILRQTIVGTTSAVVQQELSIGHIDLGNSALGAFGNALGSSLANTIDDSGTVTRIAADQMRSGQEEAAIEKSTWSRREVATPGASAVLDGLGYAAAGSEPQMLYTAQAGGHYYLPLLLGKMVGLSDERVATIAAYSQFPDQVSALDGYTNGVRSVESGQDYDPAQAGEYGERAIHALNGRPTVENLRFYQDEISKYSDDDARVGIAMHGLVDSIFHSRPVDGVNVTYDAPIGHGLHGSEPDYISEDQARIAAGQLMSAFETVGGVQLSSDQRAQAMASVNSALDRARALTNGQVQDFNRMEDLYGTGTSGSAPKASEQMELNFRSVVTEMMGTNMRVLSPPEDLPTPFWRGPITPEGTVAETQHFLGGSREDASIFANRGMQAAQDIMRDFAQTSTVFSKYQNMKIDQIYDTKVWSIRGIVPGYQITIPHPETTF